MRRQIKTTKLVMIVTGVVGDWEYLLNVTDQSLICCLRGAASVHCRASSKAVSKTTRVCGSKELLWKPRIAPPLDLNG